MLRALRGIIGDVVSEREVAGRLCRACVTGVDVNGAAMSLLTTSDQRETLSATDPTAATLEDLQFTLGEGVCIEAAVGGRPVLVPDLHDHVLTTRWPVFAAAVAEQTDVRALFALPLQLGTINLGVLDLYRTTPGPLRGPELRDIVAAVDITTFMLLSASARTSDGHQSDGDTPTDNTPVGGTRMVIVSGGTRTTVRGGTGCGPIAPRCTRPPGWFWPSSAFPPRTLSSGYAHTRSPPADRCPRSPATSSPADWCSPKTWTEARMEHPRPRHGCPGHTCRGLEGCRA